MPVGYTSQSHTKLRGTSKDCLLYALGVGAGVLDPTGFEPALDHREQPGRAPEGPADVPGRRPRSGAGAFSKIGSFNPAMLVHGEQSVELHDSLPVEGTVESVTTITGIYDKGSGAVVGDQRRPPTTRRHREGALDHDQLGVHPWRRRLGRRPRTPSSLVQWRSPTGPRDHAVTYATPPGPGAPVPPVG